MFLKKIFILLLFLNFVSFSYPHKVFADWPMPGHDLKRTSYAPEDNITKATVPHWRVPFDDYIPSKAHIITVDRGSNSMVYVPTSRGVYALNPETGAKIWKYETPMPVGHSPTIVNDVMYVGVMDKTIHAVNAITGNKMWQTDSAGAGFYVNPLVVNGKVYAGSKDGYFYAFSASNGSLLWYFKTGGPIVFSAAYDNGVIYFASNDSHAYALNANTGSLIWKSQKFLGDGFMAYWPVIHNNYVLLVQSINYPGSISYTLIRKQYLGTVDGEQLLYPYNSISGTADLDASRFKKWVEMDPNHETLFVLDKNTGKKNQTAPILWWGNATGTRYPPAIGPNGKVWINTPWQDNSAFGAGRYAGWALGTTKFSPRPDALRIQESADEPEAHAIFGGAIYYNAGGAKVDGGGIFDLNGGSRGGWGVKTWYDNYGENWYGNWPLFRYGNQLYVDETDPVNGFFGHHGYQNPPVPLNGKIYLHRSNTVFCLRQAN